MPAEIIIANETDALLRIREPGVQAVIAGPVVQRSWEAELAASVESGAFDVPRCQLLIPCAEAFVHILEQALPETGLSFETRLALVDDLALMGERLAQLAQCRGMMLRLLTEAPSEHCGFHVDTVAPDRQPFGILKVYNGEGTFYVEPGDVTSAHDFYGYLAQRERLAREWQDALQSKNESQAAHHLAALRELDAARPFLRAASKVHQVPAGAIVAFRHLDVREHWSNHGSAQAWIHCSPMTGARRLVANLTPLDTLGGLPQ